MMRRLISCTALATAFWGMPASAQTVITASSWLPPAHPLAVAQKSWCDLLEKTQAR
jgi:hypothetical protein